jgi:hypothetical protein
MVDMNACSSWCVSCQRDIYHSHTAAPGPTATHSTTVNSTTHSKVIRARTSSYKQQQADGQRVRYPTGLVGLGCLLARTVSKSFGFARSKQFAAELLIQRLYLLNHADHAGSLCVHVKTALALGTSTPSPFLRAHMRSMHNRGNTTPRHR